MMPTSSASLISTSASRNEAMWSLYANISVKGRIFAGLLSLLGVSAAPLFSWRVLWGGADDAAIETEAEGTAHWTCEIFIDV